MTITASARGQPRMHGVSPRHRVPYSRTAAALTALAGLVACAVGGGVGLRFLAKQGLSWTAVAGLMLLLIGLALLAFSARSVWRRTHRWQRLWFIPAVPAVLLVTWSLMVGTMLACAPRTPLGSVTPASRGLAYTDVTFRTSDRVRLSAWYIATVNHAAVVTVPGSGSNRSATLDQAEVLARHGYGVLLLDPRGQGRSAGHANDAGWYGDRDLTPAVTFLQHQQGVDVRKIAVLGLSMGGEEAIGAAAADPTIRAVVAEGATHRTAADKAGYLPGGIGGFLQRALDELTYGTTAVLSPAPMPGTLHSAIAHARGSQFLLIAASKGVDESAAVAYLRTAAPGRVQTWTVAGASHTHGLQQARSEWTTRVTEFLGQALGVASPAATR